jgi:putative transposase
LWGQIFIPPNNRNPESSEAFLYLGSIAMLLNRLYPRC